MSENGCLFTVTEIMVSLLHSITLAADCYKKDDPERREHSFFWYAHDAYSWSLFWAVVFDALIFFITEEI